MQAPSPTVTSTALHLNLQRLLVIRLIVFALQLAALGYARFVLNLDLSYQALIGILILLAVLNGMLFLRLRDSGSPREQEFFMHLLLDVAGLSLLLYFSGGATNPFVSYFLVPVTIAAATLRGPYTWMLAGIALLAYSLLLFYYQPIAVLLPEDAAHQHDPVSGGFNLHIVGMWFIFLVSAALIAWFVTRMANEIRHQEERLSRYREDTLRNEQILAVATQAAGTAHELGTPLGTMAVLLKDMQLESGNEPELNKAITTLQNQVARCRQSLQQLSRKADFRNLRKEVLPVAAFAGKLLDEWQLLQPERSCTLQVPDGPAPSIEADLTLQQAFINIMNNAAEAGDVGISLALDWDDSECRFLIRDFGEGVSRELREQLGTSIVSTKEGGMGVGLVLSQATINRHGGKVSLYPAEPGTLTEVRLPLHREDADG